MKLRITISKYHLWYLCQISLQIMLLFVYTTTHKRFVIFTCRYFKLSRNTTALSQSNCRHFSCNSSITVKILFAILAPLYNKLNELTIFVYSYFEKGCRKKCTFYRSQLFAESTKATYKTHRNVYLGFCHYIGYTRPFGKPGLDWTGLVSTVQSSFSIWSATHPCPFTRRTFFIKIRCIFG